MGFDLYFVGIKLFDGSVILFMVLGVLLGIIVGALPGLTATMGVSILVPLTYSLSPTAALMMLLGIYCAANYAGSISATLVNIPGTPSAVMTTLDAYPMAQKGQAGRAIGLATLSSALGGLFSVFTLALFSPLIASVALKFTSLEMFLVALWGISIMAYVSPGSTLKGLVSGFLGLLLATIGFDPLTAAPRYTFGSVYLSSGVQFIAVMIGLFGVSEILLNIEKNKQGTKQELFKVEKSFESLKEVKSLWGTILRSSVVGVIIGAIPGAGGTIASIVAYAQQKRLSKHPEELGRGAPDGIAAAESANNACTGGAMTTLLSLGIPGDAVTAILIGAFVLHGLQPGPFLFEKHFDLVSAIFIGMALINILFFLFGMFGAKYFARLLFLPRAVLNTGILSLCVIGTYAVQSSIFDVGVMLVFGLIGYLMSKQEIPRAPLVLGLILGPLMEENFRRWIGLAHGKYVSVLRDTYSKNPISIVLTILVLLTFLLPLFQKQKRISEDASKYVEKETKQP
ncbi:MAG: tripartite tricarboxylate transporter permease [Spirochaetes bacterium]|nr:tripartite tricarboxylate transporter permease [Spirochaetota bacterium]